MKRLLTLAALTLILFLPEVAEARLFARRAGNCASSSGPGASCSSGGARRAVFQPRAGLCRARSCR